MIAEEDKGRVETVFFSQNGTGRYFGASREKNCVEVRVKEESATCYGVNLAVVTSVVPFFRWRENPPLTLCSR
jgi:hypothetical protein